MLGFPSWSTSLVPSFFAFFSFSFLAETCPGPVIVDSKTFGAKFTSKKECYRFLTHDCGAYLANYQSMTIYHMRDLISGDRTRIKEEDVKYINVPYFDGLKIESFLQYAADKPEVMSALPLL